MNGRTKHEKSVPALVMHVFGFLLLWEWLRPLAVITATKEVYIFSLFVFASFLLSFFHVKSLLKTFIKIVLILYLLNSVYYGGFFFRFDWIPLLLSDFSQSIGSILQQDWWGMTPIFRSFLFFLLLWVMSYLVLFWLIQKKRILVFFILSIAYIALLDTFSPYLADGAIIRLVAIGFMMICVLSLERVFITEKLLNLSGHLTRVFVPLMTITLLATSIGYFAPKAAPQWPDPVPFLKGYGKGGIAQSSMGSPIKKIGYGTNDSKLGGPFFGDDTPVFFATVSKRHYWRIETKDLYTGKGWEISDNPEQQTFQNKNNILSWYEFGVETETKHAVIDMVKEYNHINYPAGLTMIEADSDVFYSANPLTEKIRSTTEEGLVALDEYKMSYEQPIFDVEQLRRVKGGSSLESDSKFVDAYTQLPKGIPERVKDLAVEITSNETNRYDQVIAVERYFKENSFIYDTRNVEIPDRNQDYVDQFLFETQIGYCDNFSTSMIVLLRSVGIPARWVKGYTAGSYEESSDNEQSVYKITNNNAHSWVEVYFPTQGWVPFEPTKGFSNLTDFEYNTAVPTNDWYQEDEEESTSASEEILESEDQVEEVEDEELTESSNTNWIADIPVNWNLIGGIIGVVLLISLIGSKTRGKWYPVLVIQLFRRRTDEGVYFKAYNTLLKHLEKSGIKRSAGQTLRDYAADVDKHLNSTEMQQLTRSYERALYRNDHVLQEWHNSIELWENLIEKVSS